MKTRRSTKGTAARLEALLRGLVTVGSGGLLGLPCGSPAPVQMPVGMFNLEVTPSAGSAAESRARAAVCAELCGSTTATCSVRAESGGRFRAKCEEAIGRLASADEPWKRETSMERLDVPPQGMDCPSDKKRGEACRWTPDPDNKVLATWESSRAESEIATPELCKKACSPEAEGCDLTIDYSSTTLRCWRIEMRYPGAGRRPPGLCLSARPNAVSDAGARLAEMARLEAASVTAFRVLRAELRLLGAPRKLLHRASRAARDEIRHARTTGTLARRRGAIPEPPRVEPRAPRALEELALDNAIEGCVRETYGALVATWQSRVAEDRHGRDAMTRIARDETRHAALSWDIWAWAERRLSPVARRRVRAAARQALSDLAREVSGEPLTPGLAELGMPAPEEARRLVLSLGASLFPAARETDDGPDVPSS